MQYSDLAVGMKAEFSRQVSDADVRAFADVTGDRNPVHLDEEAASRTRFGGRIAHGMLSAGIISAAIAGRLPGPGSVYLSQTLKFTAPVRIGDTVTASITVLELLSKNRVRLATTCRNQSGETVLDGEAVILVDPQP
jgi:3-hydroxybutyryl-CoA dehydratase